MSAIHLHHVQPLAEVHRAYDVDPVRYLRPVCPNFRAMLHRQEPPLKIGQLKRKIRRC